MRLRTAALAAVCLLFLAAPSHRRAVHIGNDITLVAERSFVITDKPVLEPFTFERVMDTLVARSGAPGLTSAQLYRQWFDTQNPKPGLADPNGPHCDDTIVNGKPVLNGFVRRCPTPEGALAAQPFTAGEYIPIEIANRFDMAPADGSNCGQYRIVFARKPGKLHAIFEAFLPNPHPEKGIEGCREVAQFWADLSSASLDERRARLQTFFFDGLPGFEPVVAPDHYAIPGGIRTLQQTGTPLEMLQFRIARQCTNGTCTMRIVPDVLENTPTGRYLDTSDQSEGATKFRDEFIRQLPTIAIADISRFFAAIPTSYLLGDTSPSDVGEPPFIYDITFGKKTAPDTAAAYRSRIQTELTKMGSTLTPEDIVTRAETLNCIGCHFIHADVGNGVVFPQAIRGGQQVTEDALVDGEAGPQTRYAVSLPVTQMFLPNRMKVLKDFLLTGKPPVHSQ